MAPEFLGIHLLYLHSKISAGRTVSLILLGAVIVLGGYVIQQEQKITQLKHEMKEGNNIQCDPGYIAKVVQGPKVTCLMLRTAPGSVTNRIAKN